MSSDVRERLLQATYDCVARWGLAKTTVEDAAREAGVSRATVYRYFPGGRDELISAVVGWEFARFFLRLYQEVSDAESLEEVMERGLMFAHHALVEHEVLQRILVTEPEILLPAPDHRGRSDAHTGGRASWCRTWCATAWPRAPSWTRRPTSWPAWCSRTSRRRDAGTSTTPSQVALLVRSELLAGIR